MADPAWLKKMVAEGRVTQYGVNQRVLDRALPSAAVIKTLVDLFASWLEQAQSEAECQRHVVALAQRLSWRVVHTRRVLVTMGQKRKYETPWEYDGSGSFDLDFYRERHFKAELKFGKNAPDERQKAWKLWYDEAGVENYIWWPQRDYTTIVETLTCHRPRRS